MSYITPSTYIYILEGVPFDETYQHSIYFANTTAQYNYFSTKIKYRFNAQTYQRVKRGYCRVQQKADTMYGCNYMMFQNTAYGTKWFYAFILDVEYINDNVSEIHYEIDVLQSWLFRPASGSTEYDSHFEFNKCFVNREHTVTDNLWENNVPEGLDVGEYKIADLTGSSGVLSGTNCVAIVSSAGWFSPQDHTVIDWEGGSRIGGVYTGAQLWKFEMTELSDADDFLLDVTTAGKSDAIVGVYMMPSAIFNSTSYRNNPYTETWQVNSAHYTLDGWTPNNKKLYNSPYQMLVVDTGDTCAVYNYEYFDYDENTGDNCYLRFYATPVDVGKYIVYPRNYKGMADNIHEAVFGNCGAMCSYSIDSYKAWLAQNQYTLSAQEKVIDNNYRTNEWMSTHHAFQNLLGLNGGGGAVSQSWQPYDVSTVTPSASGRADYDVSFESGYSRTFNLSPKKLAQTGTNVMADYMANKNQKTNATLMLEATKQAASIKPNIPMGSNVNSIRIATDTNIPRVYRLFIREEFAKIIDGYFDRYGYAVHTFKVPTLNNRPYWTYVQTVDCTIKGNIPNDDSTKICAIFNSGITFWTSGANVGNYSLGENGGNAPT